METTTVYSTRCFHFHFFKISAAMHHQAVKRFSCCLGKGGSEAFYFKTMRHENWVSYGKVLWVLLPGPEWCLLRLVLLEFDESIAKRL